MPSYARKFSIQKFSETQDGSPRMFLDNVRQKIQPENRDIPLFGKKLFHTPFFLKHRKVSLRKVSVPIEKIMQQNLVLPPLSSKKIRLLKILETPKRFLRKKLVH